MKKIIMIMALAALLRPAIAQEKVSIGVKAGIISSDIYHNENLESDPKLGFTGGVFMSAPIGKYFGVQPEVLYTQRVFLATSSANGNAFSFTRTTGSIDVPVYLQFRPFKFLSILGGPQYSFLVNKSDRFRDGRITEEEKQQIINSDLQNGTIGLACGADIHISKLVFSGRFGWDLQGNKFSANSSSFRYNNKWIQGTVGIRL